MTTSTPVAKHPLWFKGLARAGLAWNLFGVVQFAMSLQATPESLMQSGLSAEQAQVMTSYPAWMTLAFAIGTFGGLIGTALLIARHRAASGVLAASLAGYVVLYVGDITEGVFAVMGAPQVIILTLVVMIAAGLLWMARWSARHHVG